MNIIHKIIAKKFGFKTTNSLINNNVIKLKGLKIIITINYITHTF